MNVGEIKAVISSFINRREDAFTKNGVDNIFFALNASKNWAQRTHNFEYLVREGFVNPAPTGTPLSGILDAPGGTPIVVKAIKQVWALSPTNYRMEVDFLTSRLTSSNIALVQKGSKLYTYRPNRLIGKELTDFTGFYLDVYEWLPDFTSDSDTNFLTEFHSDWLVASTLRHLTTYLKEDVRLPMIDSNLSALWQSVLTWDELFSYNRSIN